MEDTFYLGIKALIRNSKGEVLLLKISEQDWSKLRIGAYWDMPGGRIEQGATIEETLRREVAEETGITEIKNIQKLAMTFSNIRIPQADESTRGLILAIYTCEAGNIEEITLSKEHTEYAWYSPKEASDLLRVKYPEEFTSMIAAL